MSTISSARRATTTTATLPSVRFGGELWENDIVRCDIREVGPRDGLQNEPPVPVADRVRLIDALAEAGLARIEAASFVHPRSIPAMAGAEEVLASIERRPGVAYTALVPNRKGAERALAAGADELETAVSASATHNKKNWNRTPDETLEEI